MMLIANLWNRLVTLARLLTAGLWAVASLSIGMAGAFFAGRGGAGIKAFLLQPASQRKVFAALRLLAPNLSLSQVLIKCYDNSGTVIVSRGVDVREVLDRQADFEVVYEPRMRAITGEANFFLGMQDGADYRHDTSLMQLAMRRSDVETRVAPLVRREATRLVAARPDRLDLPTELTRLAPAAIVTSYFGIDTLGTADLITWASEMFWYLFLDLDAQTALDQRALAAAKACRLGIDTAIADRKRSGAIGDDVLGRCLTLQAATPEFDDLAIRNNLIGLVIGAIPTLSKAACQALDYLLDHPDLLAKAQAAARQGDEATVGRYLLEALRFNPVNPVIYRRAVRDCVIARSTLRACTIPAGRMVLASNLSAMFDPGFAEQSDRFWPERPFGEYMLWGYGLHTCFGAEINRAALPAMLTPVLAKQSLRRAEGAPGRLRLDEMNFPEEFVVTYSR